MKARRDLTKAQFFERLQKLGFKPTGFCGYVTLPEPCTNISVCAFNCAGNRRAQLAYLIAEHERLQRRAA
jgi:hypothetical protein